MKFNYQLSSVLGSVYKGGQVVFTGDGRYLVSPVGNRLSFFDLVGHAVSTLDAVVHRDIATLALSPDGRLLLAVDVEGGAAFINVSRRAVLCQIHFKKPVSAARFSPDSKLVAVSHGRLVQLWRCPPLITQFRPLTLLRTLTGHYDEVLWLDWSHDGNYLLSASEDMSARLHRIQSEGLTPEQAADAAAAADSKVGVAGEEGKPAAAAAAPPAVPDLPPITLTGHRGAVVGCFFGQPSAHLSGAPLVYTVSKDGALFVWHWVTEGEYLAEKARREATPKPPRDEEDEEMHEPRPERVRAADTEGSHAAQPKKGNTGLFGSKGRFKLASRHYFSQQDSATGQSAKVLCTALHRAPQVDLLVVGFSSGVFGLYELPDFNNIHTLSISQKRISSVCVSPSGQWLAFGCAKLGQLLVWEWQSESYILKQQGHFYDINALSFSPDGAVLATAGDDAKVKLWNTVTGFCFVTFANHTAPVTACHWSGTGNVLLTASMDGTVRAYDLVRYRNFRTLATPSPAQLTSLAVDPAGEVVCAGSVDPFEVYVWSLQTGKLLDVLAGHTGPLSGLSFAAGASLLASSSWDKTVRLWDVFSGKGLVETLQHTSDVLAVCFRPDGKELISASLEGNLNIWDVAEGKLKGVIEGRRDIQGGRRVDDARAAENATHNTAFTTVCYSSDGSAVLAGGNSRFVCLYDVASKLLLRKFVISSNLSMDGLLDRLDSRRWTEAGGSMDLIDDQLIDPHEDDPESRIDRTLPGARGGDFSSRRTRLAVRSKAVRFAPTGSQWAVATTDGLLLFALDPSLLFEPSELSMDVTPANVRRALREKEFVAALVMALSLNQPALVQDVVESVPPAHISLVVRALPAHRLERFLAFLAAQIQRSSHLEFLLTWARTVMQIHAPVLAQAATSGVGAAAGGATSGGSSGASALLSTFRLLAKTLGQAHKDVAQLCNENTFTLDYLAHMSANKGSQELMRITDGRSESKAEPAAGKTAVKREKV